MMDFGLRLVLHSLEMRGLKYTNKTPASVVPQRPLMAVYLHVRRSYHPYGKLGAWCVSEDNDLVQ
jgi:hypothetical protein